ncbi:23S rRNA (adenine(1618)-N(6))-methyltransferase RlmF [Mucilaginibacter agri]|uniref:Ribosomal RNA large subunit methyltransferase F n=1 Tax=Mucilaginibacter agri TaxID=2695265 RepID=A0A965ZF19_9SPHI|nr:23S rRNA (adenine(1618)-N(6))-methyltransferase RlmF [Mucilaginibacter agri]NCD69530.1 23S rRNA (adenine(1618)-N(6))-methyltransferase RlmF [Mucilaginibacter agri]
MPQQPNSKPTEKDTLHPRNVHRDMYDFKKLRQSNPVLKDFVSVNQYGNESINFSNPDAVKALNKALLKHFYKVNEWDIPAGYLCPPIPGRADYIHYVADLLAENNGGTIPTGSKVKVLDIGVGANCVYPLIGSSVYGWSFVGSDTDPGAIQSAKRIVSSNKNLEPLIELRQQTNRKEIFNWIIKPNDKFDITICNPPFHASLKEAHAGTNKKWENLNGGRLPKALLNFGGKNNELWTPGGEAAFIRQMVEQSVLFAEQCLWFSTLVSKKDSLPIVYKALERTKATNVKTINMAQGQKVSRVVAWTFFDEAGQQNWMRGR